MGMRRVLASEISGDFERDLCWKDDEKYLYHPNPRKASVMGYQLRLDTILGWVEQLSLGRRIGDFATATGTFGLMLAEKGFEVTAVDINSDFLNYALKKHAHGDYKTVHSNIMEYQTLVPFDCVVIGEVIEHVAYPKDLLAACRRNLKKDGILILSTPNGNQYGSTLPTYSQVTDLSALIPRQFHWGDHLFLYTDVELKALLEESGFEVIQIEKLDASFVSQMKGIRYLFPKSFLKWLEKKTRGFKKNGKDTTCCIVVAAKKKVD